MDQPSPDDLKLLDPEGNFRRRLSDDRAAIARLAETGELAELKIVVHRLAGAAGTFGYAEVGDIAIEIDDLFEDKATAAPILEATRGLLNALDRALVGSA